MINGKPAVEEQLLVGAGGGVYAGGKRRQAGQHVDPAVVVAE